MNTVNNFESDFIFVDNIEDYNNQLIKLQTQLATLYTIVDMSRFINKNMLSDDFIVGVNEKILHAFRVKYSSLYLYTQREFVLHTSNLSDTSHHKGLLRHLVSPVLNLTKQYLINYPKRIFNQVDTKSLVGIPIAYDTTLLGFIIIEHDKSYYFDSVTVQNLEIISNHVAVAIENNRLYNRMKVSSEKDGLTGLYNRKYFYDAVQQRVKCLVNGYTIMMIDIDNFKLCNDTYGHQYGDKVLQDTACMIVSKLRRDDIVARYGGEEIIAYLYGMIDIDAAQRKADYIRECIQNHVVMYCTVASSVTVSIGVCVVLNTSISLNTVIGEADSMLYKSKHTGRNCCSVTAVN